MVIRSLDNPNDRLSVMIDDQDVYVPIRIVVENNNEILKGIKLENDIKKHYK